MYLHCFWFICDFTNIQFLSVVNRFPICGNCIMGINNKPFRQNILTIEV